MDNGPLIKWLNNELCTLLEFNVDEEYSKLVDVESL
jgi:hypothetical protein